MKRLMKLRRSPIMAAVLFVMAGGFLLTGTIGAVRAAPQAASSYYSAGIGVDSGIQSAVLENGMPAGTVSGNGDYAAASGRVSLLGGLLGEGEAFQPGRTYEEELSVQNAGSIDTYVRATVYKYWVKDGEKSTSLDPGAILLEFASDGGWVVDTAASTEERTVLYYTGVLPAGESTPAFARSVAVDGSVLYQATQTRDGGVITTTYDYDGAAFRVEVKVDAVQTHNAEQAIQSAWGRRVTVSDGVLALASE